MQTASNSDIRQLFYSIPLKKKFRLIRNNSYSIDINLPSYVINLRSRINSIHRNFCNTARLKQFYSFTTFLLNFDYNFSFKLFIQSTLNRAYVYSIWRMWKTYFFNSTYEVWKKRLFYSVYTKIYVTIREKERKEK